MKISTINGWISGEPEKQMVIGGEQFYLVNLRIEEGLDIALQVSEYTLPSIVEGRVEVMGNLCTRAIKGKKYKINTYFRAKKITPTDEDAPVKKTIYIDGIVQKVFDTRISAGGLEYVTLSGLEVDEARHTSLIHYTCKGRLARRISATAHSKEIISGEGILHRKKEGSFEVLITDVKITPMPEKEVTQSA